MNSEGLSRTFSRVLLIIYFLPGKNIYKILRIFTGATTSVLRGAVTSWLAHSSTDLVVRIRALAWDTVLCSWARHFTLTVPLSTQEYKWVPVICWGNLTNCWGVTCDGLASHPGGVEILLAASCYGNRDKLRPDEPVGSIRLHNVSVICHQ